MLFTNPVEFTSIDKASAAKVTHLYLANILGNFLNDRENLNLAKLALSSMSSLTHLNLAANKLPERVVVQLLMALKVKLKVLNLRGNPITNIKTFEHYAEVVIFPGSQSHPADFTPPYPGWVFNEPMSECEIFEMLDVAVMLRQQAFTEQQAVNKLNHYRLEPLFRRNELFAKESIETNLTWSVIFDAQDKPYLLPKYRTERLPPGIKPYNYINESDQQKAPFRRMVLTIGLDSKGLIFPLLKRKVSRDQSELENEVTASIFTSHMPSFGLTRAYANKNASTRFKSGTLTKTYFFAPYIESNELFDIISDLVNNYSTRAHISHIVKLSLQTTKQQKEIFFACMLEFLCCRAAGVRHRDIKPENIKYSKEKCYAELFDFGFASSSLSTEPKSRSGTPGWVAPEIVYSDGEEIVPLPQHDDYAIGLVSCVSLYPICWSTNYPLVLTNMRDKANHPKNHLAMLQHYRNGITVNYSEPLASLVTSLCDPNPETRAKPNEVFFSATQQYSMTAFEIVFAKLQCMRNKFAALCKTYPAISQSSPTALFVPSQTKSDFSPGALVQMVNLLFRQQVILYYLQIFDWTNGNPSQGMLATLRQAVGDLAAQPDKPIAELNSLYFLHQGMEDLIYSLYNEVFGAKPNMISLKPRI